jgi:hypothetical protein
MYVQAVWYQDMFYLDILTLEMGPIGYPKTSKWNYNFIMCKIPEVSWLQNMFIFSMYLVRTMPNGRIYDMCSVILIQKISSRVKSHDLPGQGIGPALPNQHICSRFKSSFIPKNRLLLVAWTTSLACSTFRSHLNTDHTWDSPEIRKIFQLHYGTVKQWPSQQMCV